LCVSFGLGARIPALAIHKRFVESGWTQQSNRLAFGSDRMITIKNENKILVAMMFHQNELFFDD
jgi:hypothetical protein